jgi:miniconductance mechanosensitive channel
MVPVLPLLVLTWREEIARWIVGQPLLATALPVLGLLLIAWFASVLTRRVLVQVVGWLVRRSRFAWDDALYARGFFHRLGWGVPLWVVWSGLAYLPRLSDAAIDLATRLATVGLLLVAAGTVVAAIRAFGDAQVAARDLRAHPIEGYLRAAILAVVVGAAVFSISVLVDLGPILILGGLGAATAVAALIFREPILGLVAGLQLTGSELIQEGDWIEMPRFDAHGEVVDIALNTVKVQNRDRTFTVIPGHRFLEESFKNWRGMRDAGGRRIRSGLAIDLHSIRFLEPGEVDDLRRRFAALRPYLDGKRHDIDARADGHDAARMDPVNARRLTNIGAFRAYVASYVRGRPDIHDDMTFLIRQFDPGPEGLPLEVCAFSTETDPDVHEGVQADVVDHLLAILPAFGLRLFQKPSGGDVARLDERTTPGKRITSVGALGD